MPAAPLVTLDHVDVDLAGVTVLRDVTWRLARAEHWGVVGANGSGKSTFLGLVAGTLWPAPGRGLRRYDFGAGEEIDAVRARSEIVLVGHELQDRYARLGWNFTALDVVLSGIYRTDVPRRRPAAGQRERALAELQR
jgi:iron complex transport system ATP-binding protein